MGAFEYIAFDAAGKKCKGVLAGDNSRQVRHQLRDRGLLPLSVTLVAEKKTFWGWKGIRTAELSVITRQLATLVRAGTVFEEALAAVASQSGNTRAQKVLLAVRSRILEGFTIDQATSEFPGVFSELYRSALAAGEQAGHLDLILERLADYIEGRRLIQQKLLLALLYPALLTGVAFMVIAILMAHVIPQVVEVFTHTGQQLPMLTSLLIAASNFFSRFGLIIFAALAAAMIFSRIILRQEQVRRRLHHRLLRMPVAGKIIKTMDTARFARSFSILLASGVPVLDGLAISSQAMANLGLREALSRVRDKVREGASIHESMAAEECFPPLTIHLLASGEASANLEQMLDQAAATQEKEMETLIAVGVGLFEPLMILVMGGIVLAIVMAILLPIIEMNQLVR